MTIECFSQMTTTTSIKSSPTLSTNWMTTPRELCPKRRLARAWGRTVAPRTPSLGTMRRIKVSLFRLVTFGPTSEAQIQPRLPFLSPTCPRLASLALTDKGRERFHIKSTTLLTAKTCLCPRGPPKRPHPLLRSQRPVSQVANTEAASRPYETPLRTLTGGTTPRIDTQRRRRGGRTLQWRSSNGTTLPLRPIILQFRSRWRTPVSLRRPLTVTYPRRNTTLRWRTRAPCRTGTIRLIAASMAGALRRTRRRETPRFPRCPATVW